MAYTLFHTSFWFPLSESYAGAPFKLLQMLIKAFKTVIMLFGFRQTPTDASKAICHNFAAQIHAPLIGFATQMLTNVVGERTDRLPKGFSETLTNQLLRSLSRLSMGKGWMFFWLYRYSFRNFRGSGNY